MQIRHVLLALLVLVVMTIVVGQTLPPDRATAVLSVLIVLTAMAGALGMAIMHSRVLDPLDVDSRMPDDDGEPDQIDPWQLQRVLMEASNQFMPDKPAITNTSVLYAALIMEESGETFEALAAPLMILSIFGAKHEERVLALELHERLAVASKLLKADSLAIRALLKDREFYMELTEDQAIPIFDGTTDIAVVNSGFCLASGMEGGAGYFDVVDSNLSKRNPETGKIDKTPDGKWIKGVEYREPNLAAVLRRTAQERSADMPTHAV